MKTFILGLDGATFDQLAPLMEEGFLPNIKSMCDQFAHGPLKTVFPPVTAPAWLSMATGLNPGKTGVFDYINKSSADSETFTAISSSAYSNRALWNYLNSNGYEVGLFNYPTLFPPPHIKGFVVSGMGAKNNTPLCYPMELNEELESITDTYEVTLNLRNKKYNKDITLFFKDLDRIIDTQKKVLMYLIQNKKWDFFFAVFSFTDWMQHVLWKDIDQNHPLYNSSTSPAIHQLYRQMWQKVDEIIGDLLNILPHDTNFLIVSDHGSGPLDSVFYPNTWLEQIGCLKRKKTSYFKSLITDTFTILSESYDNKYTSRLSNFIRKRILKINTSTDFIDMENSLAYSPEHNTMFGCINLTMIGKTKEGFKDNLIKELLNLPQKYSGITSLQVILPEDIYTGPYINLSPDIYFIVNEYRSTTETAFAKKIFQTSPSIVLRTGSHRTNGIFIAKGNIFKKSIVKSSILDIAPTILALYNIPIPQHIDGEVITGCICEKTLATLNINKTDDSYVTTPPAEQEDDLEEMKNLLKSLGYM